MNARRQKVDLSRLTPVLKHKWPGAMLDEGFVPMPKRLLRCAGKIFSGPTRLSQLRLVLAIVDDARPDQKHLPTMPYFAFVTGMPLSRVDQCMKQLVERQLLTCTQSATGLVIDYGPLVRLAIRLTEEDD